MRSNIPLDTSLKGYSEWDLTGEDWGQGVLYSGTEG
jgi:hypothetical protein